ncbi:MAG: VOC family protein [Chloroflexi bacterium]|nr:VOC family protein [Chloroflexota bacterium]
MWLNHVHLGVRDLDRAVAFYRDTLSLEVSRRDTWASVRVGPTLSVDLDHRPDQSDGPKPVIIGFVVESADEAYAQLKAKGVALEGEPEDQYWGVRNFYFCDPDGYQIEVAQPLVRGGATPA